MEPPPWLPLGLALEECEAKALAQTKQHCVAERKRRERINSHMAALRTLLPDTAQSDKASLLAAAVKTLRDLEDEATKLTEQGVLMPSDTDELEVEEMSVDACSAKQKRESPGQVQGDPTARESGKQPRKKVKVEAGAGAGNDGAHSLPGDELALREEDEPKGVGKHNSSPSGGKDVKRGELQAQRETEIGETRTRTKSAAAGSVGLRCSVESSGLGGSASSHRRGSETEGESKCQCQGVLLQPGQEKACSMESAQLTETGESAARYIRVRVSAEDKWDLLSPFKKTIQLLKLELVKLDTASCWNRVTHEMLLVRTEQGGCSRRTEEESMKSDDPASSAAEPNGDLGPNANERGQAQHLTMLPARTAKASAADGSGKRVAEQSPSLEVIHAAFKASIDRVKAKAAAAKT